MPEKTISIAFRGLMVLNYQGDEGTRFMEIGLLDARAPSGHGGGHADNSTVHIPRVLTMENGVLAELLDLRNSALLGAVRRWSLSVISPTAHTQATLRGTGPFNRTTAPTTANREDFRWVIDFEAADMHATDLTREISTARLLMVLKVEKGEFFTKLISPTLNRREKGVIGGTPYGFSAAVTGLEIKCNVADTEEASVDLMAGSTIVKRLQTKTDRIVNADGSVEFKVRDRVFEISNGPPDVLTDAPIPDNGGSHFHMFYDGMFIQSPPNRQFDFVATGNAPAPRPALCGVSFLGQRTDPL